MQNDLSDNYKFCNQLFMAIVGATMIFTVGILIIAGVVGWLVWYLVF